MFACGAEFFGGFYAERGGGAGQSQKVGGEVTACKVHGVLVLGAEEFFGGGEKETCEFFGKSALFHHFKKAEPNAVDGKEREGEGGGFFPAFEERGEKPVWVYKEERGGGDQKDDGKNSVHA